MEIAYNLECAFFLMCKEDNTEAGYFKWVNNRFIYSYPPYVRIVVIN